MIKGCITVLVRKSQSGVEYSAVTGEEVERESTGKIINLPRNSGDNGGRK
jgi:hypothetical protein